MPTADPEKNKALNALVDEIGTEGSRFDSLTRELSKGITDGFGELKVLLEKLVKGGDAGGGDDGGADDEPDEGGGGAGDGNGESGDTGGKDKDKGGDAGYEDMNLGTDAAAAAVPDGDAVDATEFFVKTVALNAKLEKAVTQLVEDNKGLRADNAALVSRIDQLLELNRAGFSAVGSAMAPMAKAVVAVHGALAQQHTASVTDVIESNAAGARRGSAAGADLGITPVKLSKALQTHVIDQDQLRRFKSSQKFVEGDDAKNAELIQKVAALAV